MCHFQQFFPTLLPIASAMHHADVYGAYFLVFDQQLLEYNLLVRPLDPCDNMVRKNNWSHTKPTNKTKQKKKVSVFSSCLFKWRKQSYTTNAENKTYLRASWFIMPRALTAASRTSATSHLNSGTTSLYNASGDGEIAFDLSLRSAFNESGDELYLFIVLINIVFNPKKKIEKKQKKRNNNRIIIIIIVENCTRYFLLVGQVQLKNNFFSCIWWINHFNFENSIFNVFFSV